MQCEFEGMCVRLGVLVCDFVTFCPGVYRNRQLGNGCLVASTTMLDARESSPGIVSALSASLLCRLCTLLHTAIQSMVNQPLKVLSEETIFPSNGSLHFQLLCWKDSGRSQQALANTRRRL